MACRPELALHEPATAPAAPPFAWQDLSKPAGAAERNGTGRDWTGWRRRVGREEGAPSRSAKAGGLAFISAMGGVGGLALTAHGDRRAQTLGVATGAAQDMESGVKAEPAGVGRGTIRQ